MPGALPRRSEGVRVSSSQRDEAITHLPELSSHKPTKTPSFYNVHDLIQMAKKVL